MGDPSKPLFMTYASRDSRISDLVAAQHFDKDMPNFSDVASYESITTPAVSTVTDAQHMPHAVSLWLLAVIGRAMFDVREMDRWRVIPWIIGTSNTGKSTILDFVVKKMYQLQDVGVLE